jgi:hypothetical protein
MRTSRGILRAVSFDASGIRVEILGALRRLRGRWVSALFTSTTAGLGVAMFLALSTVVDGLLLKQPVPGGEHLAVLGRPHERFGVHYWFQHEEIVQAGRRLAVSVAALGAPAPLGRSPTAPLGTSVSTNFFDLIRIRPLMGRTFTTEDGDAPDRTVISEALWRARFGGAADIIGRSVVLGDRRLTIVGVAPAGFGVPAGTDVWTPIDVRSKVPFIYRVLVWLPDEGAARTLESRLPGWRLVSLREHLAPADASHALVLLGANALLLVGVWTYVGLLQAGEATRRLAESRLRLALGASWWRAVRPTLVDGCLSLLACLTVGAAAVPVLLRWLTARLPPELTAGRPIGLDGRAVVVMLGILVAGAVVTAATALPAARRSIRTGLAGRSPVVPTSTRWIVAAQFAVATPVLYVLGLAAYSFHSLIAADMGFQPDSVMSVHLPRMPASNGDGFSFEANARNVARLQGLLDRVAVGSNVEGAAFSSDRLGFVPTAGSVRLRLPEARPDDYLIAQRAVVSGGYFELLRIPVLAGRTFDPRMSQTVDRTDPFGGVVVDAVLAGALARGQNVVGRKVIVDFTPATIIGVVGAVRARRPDEPVQPRIYLSASPAVVLPTNLLVRFEDPVEPVRRAVGQAVQAEFGTPAPPDSVLLADELTRLQGSYRGRYELLSLMGWIATSLCVAGTFGVGAYTVARRRRELAVRMAVGASRQRILWACLRDLVIASAAGIAVGLGGGVLIGRQAAHLLYGVLPTDPLIIACILVLLTVAVLAGAALPVRDAWRTDVSAVLRQE